MGSIDIWCERCGNECRSSDRLCGNCLDTLINIERQLPKIVSTIDDGLPIFADVFCGIGIKTDQGLFGIAMRDDGIEIMLDGDPIFSSTCALGNAPVDTETKRLCWEFNYNKHQVSEREEKLIEALKIALGLSDYRPCRHQHCDDYGCAVRRKLCDKLIELGIKNKEDIYI